MENNEIIAKEFRSAFHLSAIPNVRKDVHVLKEVVHYKDGRIVPELRIIENFKRPFWVTKEHYQNHKEKKSRRIKILCKDNTFFPYIQIPAS